MKRTLKKLIQIAFCVAIFAAIFVELRSQSVSIPWSEVIRHPFPFLGAVALQLFTSSICFLVWHLLCNRNSAVLSLKESYKIFTITSLSRYLPAGKIWQLMTLVHLSENPKLKVQTTFSFILNVLFGLIAGSLVAALGVGIAFPHAAASMTLLFSLGPVVGVVLLCQPRLLLPFLRLFRGRFTITPEESRLSLATGFSATIISTAIWFAQGAAAILLLKMVGAIAPETHFLFLIAAYYVAIVAGFLTFLTPAGLGVREGVFVVLLQPHLPAEQAAFLAIGIRICVVLADLTFSLPLVVKLMRVQREKIQTGMLRRAAGGKV